MAYTPTPEEQAKLDAFVAALRGLARTNSCAHRLSFSHAIKAARVWDFAAAARFAHTAGIPDEQVTAVYTLIFG